MQRPFCNDSVKRVFYSATMQPSMGVAIDAAKTVIVPISMAKTDVLPML